MDETTDRPGDGTMAMAMAMAERIRADYEQSLTVG
jgi:hypothetical protein